MKKEELTVYQHLSICLLLEPVSDIEHLIHSWEYFSPLPTLPEVLTSVSPSSCNLRKED